MRRVVAVVLTVALLSVTVSASATGPEKYWDKFGSIGWGGSDGLLNWSGPWSENNDDGDEKKGNVRVVSSGNCDSGNCMRISSPLIGLLSGPIGATRRADTTVLEDASLHFDLKATGSLPLSQLLVRVNDGGGWDTVAQYNLGQANFQADLFGDIRTVTALNGVDLQADYNFAVEVIRSSWAWMALLGLLIAWAIVTGLDRRRKTD